jgi:hypothetical protein
MARKEYDAFIDNPAAVPEGKEFNLAIRELTPDDRRNKYRSRYVTALITHSPNREKDDLLWLRYNRGSLYEKPFGIKIVKELGPFEVKERITVTA